MNDNSLRKLNRRALLEILLEQTKRIEELEAELEKTKQELQNKEVSISNVGSLAEASLVLSGIFKVADEAVAIQMKNIENIAKNEEKRVKKELRELKKKKLADIEKKVKKGEKEKEKKKKVEVIPEVKEEKVEIEEKHTSSIKRKSRK